ncbi:MAG: efflux RND transporter permease subunit, partial [Tannerellaceae bacterium]|nr:efflux RND transporter permease subunit [Tannerellaceae bacterium]
VNALFRYVEGEEQEHTAYIGRQQFLLNRENELSVSEAELYFKTGTSAAIFPLQNQIACWLSRNYPDAVFTFAPPETIFEKLFVTGEPDIVTELYARNRTVAPDAEVIYRMQDKLKQQTGYDPVGVAFEKQINILVNRERLLLYHVDYSEIYRILKTAFKENEVETLRSYQQYVPITIGGDEQSIRNVLDNTLVRTTVGNKNQIHEIPLCALVSIVSGEDLKTITAGKNGEYIPFAFYTVKNPERLISVVKTTVQQESAWSGQEYDINFGGSYFSNRKMLNELVVILFISILLMYFILSAQFESFLQPLIVLIEIPMDVAFALFVLWISGHTMNLMSAIGIVVTCGIIINDSILKLDAINELRKQGIPLLEAIHEAGRRRLRPIIMTSLTTIFAMLPLLFSFDMGSELQKPLSIAMIATMALGTLVSLFIIPIVYWLIYRNGEVKAAEKQEQ